MFAPGFHTCIIRHDSLLGKIACGQIANQNRHDWVITLLPAPLEDGTENSTSRPVCYDGSSPYQSGRLGDTSRSC